MIFALLILAVLALVALLWRPALEPARASSGWVAWFATGPPPSSRVVPATDSRVTQGCGPWSVPGSVT